MVVLQSMWLAVIGVAAGLAAALGFSRLIASLLYEVKPWDPAAILSVAVVLIAIALLARLAGHVCSAASSFASRSNHCSAL
jgi:ABC-type antimicrobial peptide transport system permease subunit